MVLARSLPSRSSAYLSFECGVELVEWDLLPIDVGGDGDHHAVVDDGEEQEADADDEDDLVDETQEDFGVGELHGVFL